MEKKTNNTKVTENQVELNFSTATLRSRAATQKRPPHSEVKLFPI